MAVEPKLRDAESLTEIPHASRGLQDAIVDTTWMS
jgi:hypothetical protein